MTPITVNSEPSAFARIVLRPMTKVLNPLIRWLAGRKHFNQAARLTHQGRRSGRAYMTPVSARPGGGHFWVALTFGTGSDWCRNVLAAGECTVKWHGRDYELRHPVVLDRASALAAVDGAFKAHERAMMRAIGITHFLRLDLVAAPDDRKAA